MTDPDDPLEHFLATLVDAFATNPNAKLVLSKPRTGAGDLQRVTVRPLSLKGEALWSFLHTHKTRDVTKNMARTEAIEHVRTLLEASLQHAHLFTPAGEVQLLTSKKGKRTLLHHKGSAQPPAETTEGAKPAKPAEPATHDRAKHRYIDITRPFLAELGVTTPTGQLVPAMARKWKQINKFVEVLDHAIAASPLSKRESIEVLDFGSGKGYLTFAMHEHLSHTLGLQARVTGVELRDDMVSLCNAAADRLALDGPGGLHFERGDVSEHAARNVDDRVDIMVALHACDTATDHAIHKGVRSGAAIIMCSPCCHKELRPQLLSPHPLRPILKHGVHLGQEAEMLTDGLRALLLDACGYDTQVFEFVSLEHTNKNKMILAVKREAAGESEAIWQQVREIKAFYGIRDQCLERLLLADRAAA